jgi:hypothetical protein
MNDLHARVKRKGYNSYECIFTVTIKLLSLLLLLLFISYFRASSQTQDLAHILTTLPPIASGLTGYKITALETNIIFNQNNTALEILQSDVKTNLNKAQITMLEELTHKSTSADTNICSYVYQFGDNVISISREQFNMLGELIQKDTSLVTANEVREYHNSVKSSGEHGTGWAEIRTRATNDLFGVPQFLSKSTLRDRIESSSVRGCEIGKSLSGQNCYIINISAPPHIPIGKYKLFLQSDTFSPVEFNSYLADGTLYSRTDLQFEEPGNPPFLCKRADVQIFHDGKLHRQSIWVVEHVEEDKVPLMEKVESFIPQRTRVSDMRFSKPLFYHMGVHPPTSSQINLMLATTNGVPAYESGTYIPLPDSINNSSERRYWVRIIFIIFMVSTFFIFLPKLLKKR